MICTKCGLDKPLFSFGKRTTYKVLASGEKKQYKGWETICKKCVNEKWGEYSIRKRQESRSEKIIQKMMPKTLEEQIASKCIHFNGLMNKACKAGVVYDDFGRVKLGVIPCIKGGTATCDKGQFHTPEEVKAEMDRIRGHSAKALTLMIHVKDHYEKTKQTSGTIKCVHGDHDVRYAIAESNGHAWIACKTCEIGMNE